jgi:hypothetical protein
MFEFLIVIGFAVFSLGVVWGRRWPMKILFGLIGLAIMVITMLLSPSYR